MRKLALTASFATIAAAGALFGAGLASAATTPPPPATFLPAPGVHPSTRTVSRIWSGYNNTGGRYRHVSASWTEPTVRRATSRLHMTSLWVGLDGHGSPSVEQCGTAEISQSGSIVHRAWWELYPHNSMQFIPRSVSAGDHITGSVTFSGGKYYLTVRDFTRGWKSTTTASGFSYQRSSAEVVEEAPADAYGVLPLTQVTRTHFHNVHGLSHPSRITMMNGASTLISVSPWTGSSFSATWHHSR
jgi:hypothetical protein